MRPTLTFLAISVLAVLLFGCTKKPVITTPSPGQTQALATPMPPSPTPVATWIYQLQFIDLNKIVQTPGSVVVIDPSKNGDGDSAGFWSREEIEKIKKSGKTVLAYLSIGEAESYRDYWQAEWNENPPDFLGGPNPDWPDNFPVKYWNKEWQSVMLARVERIQNAGFDGVYLDKVDAFEDWERLAGEVELQDEMVKFVTAISNKGESTNPDFKVYLQNGWAIWDKPALAQAVDGVAIEEFSMGWEGTDGAPPPEEIKKEMLQALDTADKRGWNLLVVDYPSPETGAADKESAIKEAARVGALPLLAPRDLDG